MLMQLPRRWRAVAEQVGGKAAHPRVAHPQRVDERQALTERGTRRAISGTALCSGASAIPRWRPCG